MTEFPGDTAAMLELDKSLKATIAKLESKIDTPKRMCKICEAETEVFYTVFLKMADGRMVPFKACFECWKFNKETGW